MSHWLEHPAVAPPAPRGPTRVMAGVCVALLLTGTVPRGPGRAGAVSPGEAVSSREGWAALAHADSIFRRRMPDSALVLLDPLLRESRQRGDEGFARAIRVEQGEILATIGRAVPAEAVLREILDGAQNATGDTRGEESGDRLLLRAMRWLAYAVGQQGRLQESAAAYERVLTAAQVAGDREHEGYARLGLAYIDLLASRMPEAVSGFEQAIARFRELGARRYELIALTGLGRCHDALGDLPRARSAYAAVARGSRELGDPFTEADALNNLGGLEFVLGDPGVAVDLYRRARDLQLAHGNPMGSIIPAKNIAMAQAYAGQYDDAALALEGAARTCREQGYQTELAMILEQLGIVRRLQKRLVESATLLRAAAAPRGDVDLAMQIHATMSLACTLMEMDSIKIALTLLEQAEHESPGRIPPRLKVDLDRAAGEILFQAREYLPALDHLRRADATARRLGLSMERIGPLTFSALCHRALGRPDSCRVVLLRAAGVWENLRGRSRDPEWRERLGIDARLLYTSLGDLLSEYPAAEPASERAHAAFDLLQRFKARTLRERMVGPAGSPNDTTSSGPDAALRLEDVQQVLAEGELLLDAYLGPDVSLLFAVDRDDCRLIRLTHPPGGVSLDLGLERLRGLLAHPPIGPLAVPTQGFLYEASAALGQLLLAEAADLVVGSRRIIVAPDGALSLVPLGALAFGDRDDPQTVPLLLQREVVHVPSAALLVDLRRRAGKGPTHEGPARLLAVAAGTGSADSSLPGALEEIRWLHRRYRGVDQPVRPGPGVRAVELARYEVLHFAAHTRLDDQHPWRSSIVVAPADSSQAGCLHASEIAAQRLGARLVVLSGCESAGGHVLSGEGVLGLTGAFAAAGVPAVIATLWPVEDQVTARLVKGVYTWLGRGERVGAALRKAQLAIQSDPATCHPFYWAGFVLVGDGDVRVELRERPWWERGTRPILAVLLLGLGLLAAVACLRVGPASGRARPREG